MSFDEQLSISVSNVSKRYELYDRPHDRLKQFFLPRLNRMAGRQPKNFYKEFWALDDINFEIAKGESVGIIGRNGSGKSTLLQIVTGILSPTTGTAVTNGRIAALLELGSGFNPEFTGRENVYLNGALLGLSKEQIDEKFDKIASFADIGQHLEQQVKTYSSGMLVRLAFAVQVQIEPDILIVDEALAVGDALFQKRCFQRIEKLHSDGVTLLFVSHDQESVRTLTNRAILLKEGRLVKQGLSSEVVLEYRKQLHQEEALYFSSLTAEIARAGEVVSHENQPLESVHSESKEGATDHPSVSSATDLGYALKANEFGDAAAKVLLVRTLNAEGEACNVFYPGELICIEVECCSTIALTKLNVGLRIRNKEGVKIYSWGTLNQDMKKLASNPEADTFWDKSFGAGQRFRVQFTCVCRLGVNLYEIQSTISYEATPDYMNQRILHWRDEAAFFQVLVNRDENFFGGVADLEMKATSCMSNE
ncbi:MAG: sugar ABC transporter ATP-binding protein [unclassified Hahellaceae]|nr:sugar ABC transporter ATP-binding protein [Hahellaceae bacterium]|tara:strand:+ start:48983 stop:50416 length:1434 start_codon:yes stop_codon:yes gene_type:complete